MQRGVGGSSEVTLAIRHFVTEADYPFQNMISISTTRNYTRQVRLNSNQATLTPPHATLWAVLGVFAGASPAVADVAPVLVRLAVLGGMGSGVFLRSSKILCVLSVFLINHPAYRLPTVDSAMWTMFWK